MGMSTTFMKLLARPYLQRRRSQASILVLLELRKQCPEVFGKLEIYIDGGFERGSDILKAICLGATAVGVGRPFLYALVYGQDGVEQLSQSKLVRCY